MQERSGVDSFLCGEGRFSGRRRRGKGAAMVPTVEAVAAMSDGAQLGWEREGASLHRHTN